MTNQRSENRLIIEWTEDFAVLYMNKDKYRSPEEIWISSMAYFSQIGESIRRIEYKGLIKAAAHAFCWMCTFISKLNTISDLLFKCENNFCEMIYLKYPQRCGLCTRDKCVCDPFKMDAKPNKAAKYIELYNEYWKVVQGVKFDIPGLVQMFKSIYGTRIYFQTLENLCFHLLEEAGEEAQAIRELIQLRGIATYNINGVDENFLRKTTTIPGLVKEYEICMKKFDYDYNKIDFTSNDTDHIKARIVKGKIDLIVEFADTFSWFCALLIKLQFMASNLGVTENPYDLEKFLQIEYGPTGEKLKCPSCKSQECKCLFFPNKIKI